MAQVSTFEVCMLKTIDPLTDHRWDDFVTRHPEGNIFHHSSWARVLADRYGEVYQYYILEDNHSEIVGALPFFHLKSPLLGDQMVCLPSADCCFPLVNQKEHYHDLMADVIDKVDQKQVSSVQIRSWSKLGTPDDCGVKKGLRRWLVQVLDITGDPDSIRSHMTRNGRYNMRNADKQPMTFKIGQDEKDLKIFYNMMIQTYKKNDILPPAYSYFRSIYRHLIIQGKGYFFFCEYQGKLISSNMYLCFKDSALCKYSAQLDNYTELRPNYFLHWKAIEKFHGESYRYYDFGGTDPTNEGLLFFKRNWGCEETERLFYSCPAEAESADDHRSSLLVSPSRFIYATLKKSLPDFARSGLCERLSKYTID